MKKIILILYFMILSGLLFADNYKTIESDWQFITDKDNSGIKQGFLNNDYNTSGWLSMPCNIIWENVIGKYDGYAWYKRVENFTKEDLKYKYIYLKFKAVDEEATVYINGKLAIEHTSEKTKLPPEILWLTSFMVDIKPYLKPGDNQIKVKVHDNADAGGIYGKVSLFLTNKESVSDVKESSDIISLNPNFEDYISVGLKYKGKVEPFSLFWFSDIHGDRPELERLTTFYEHYREYFDDAICTGDNIICSSVSSFSLWKEVKGASKIMFTTGNHDTLKTHEDGYNWNEQISQKETYNLYFAPYIKNWNVNYKEGQTYYYKDYQNKKICLICLDCMQTGDNQIAQCDWLEDVLTNANEKKYSVIIATHMPFVYGKTHIIDSTFNNLDQPLGAQYSYPCYKNIKIYQEAVDKFMKEGGLFVCYITGHYHSDHIFYNEEYPNQLQIVIDAANRVQSQYENDMIRVDGHKSMDLANALIIDTNNNTLKIIRIGADLDKYFRKRDLFCYDYKNKIVK